MLIDNQTAVLVCAGPSIDRLSPVAWRAIEQAGVTVSVNGSLVARACLRNRLRFTYAAAMDVATGLTEHVPGYRRGLDTDPGMAYRAHGTAAEAESYVKEVEWWGDCPDEGYIGGSTAMVAGNWLCNPWPEDADSRDALEATAQVRQADPPPRLQAARLRRPGYDTRARWTRRVPGCATTASRRASIGTRGLQQLEALLPRSPRARDRGCQLD